MSIILDHQLREKMSHDTTAFPISYFQDELALLPDRAGPLHWHPEFEIASASSGVLEYQVGQDRILLNPGDSIFVTGNMLHSIRQISGDAPDALPNIVFFASLIAPETSVLYEQYIRPFADSPELSYVVFRKDCFEHAPVHSLIRELYRLLRDQPRCFEMAVQRNLNAFFEYLTLNRDVLPRTQVTRVQLNTQVRVQKMLAYIHMHFSEAVTLSDIAAAANISRSEAGRCFRTYLGVSPVDALILHRLQKAYSMLQDTALTLQEISQACGFHSVNYFSRRFRQQYGCAPSHVHTSATERN